MKLSTTVALALTFSSLIVLGTTCATRAADSVAYSDALKLCSADWKASDARKNTAKGEGMAAWQKFRAACVTEKGYVPNRRNVTRSDAKSETN